MDNDAPNPERPGPRSDRLPRWLGLVRLSVGRLRTQLRRVPRRTVATVTIVALTVALLVLVSAISVGLATETTATDEADVRVVPTGGGTLSSVIDVAGPKLGAVHERSETVASHDDVAYATPVLTEVVRLRTDAGESETVLAMGVVPPAEPITVEGVSTASLEPGDPHYENGSATGPSTGEIVLSDTAADGIDATAGDALSVSSPAHAESVRGTDADGAGYTVTAVDDAERNDLAGELPLVVVHLSELQSITGAEEADLADQVIVETEPGASPSAVESTVAEAFPDATIRTGGRDGVDAVRTDDFALATGLVALVVALVICSLFVATSAALTIDRDRELMAVLAAVGFSIRSRLSIVAVTTLGLTLVGALVGVVIGFVGIAITNAVATATVASGPIAAMRPAFVPYAVGVALAAGVFALPYPLYLVARTNVVAELGR